LQIRIAEDEDLPSLIPLMLEFSKEVDAELTEQHVFGALKPLLADRSIGDVWIAEDDQVLGYLVITWGWGIESGGKEALIDEIFISPPLRGQGLATALIQAALGRARDLDTKAVFLETERDNPQSRELYERLGFRTESSLWMRALLKADD
jgi:ribosomal protein S18 acetylase RimI-like enzyme